MIFRDNGEVIGFQNYKSYAIQEDYFDAGCQFDLLYLRYDIEDRFEYTWSFSSDTLIIYKLDCMTYDTFSDRCIETKRGEIVYRLLKK